MNEHKYILEPYKGMNTRYHCPDPNCGKSKTFSRYIDTETGEHIHPSVGRCNRENNCGYHYTPKQYFQDNNISFDAPQPKAHKPRPVTHIPKPATFIPVEIFKASLKGHEENHFVQFLNILFGVETASGLVSQYFIGSSRYWRGATVFWQIDDIGKIRTGKIMLYSPTTGKRVKEPFSHITWAHKALKLSEFELKQCLFGEHLLKDKTRPVAIVESEKTAIIASVYLPQFIWLAAGCLTNLSAEKCSILRGRNVTLFPDLNGFEKWSSKAQKLSYLATFTVSDLLERKATDAERKQGFDLADYLIRFNYKDFETPEASNSVPAFQLSIETEPFEKPKSLYCLSKSEVTAPETWEQDINELESYFAGISLPIHPLRLYPFTIIGDCSAFIESSFEIISANNGNRTFRPYLTRLKDLKSVIQSS